MANDFSARQPRRKYCQFCKENTEFIDYKDTQLLRKYMTDRGKIKPVASLALARSISMTSPTPSSAPARWLSCRTPSPWFPLVATATAAKKGDAS